MVKVNGRFANTLILSGVPGAYDKRKVYDVLNKHSPDVEMLIPPYKNARIRQNGNSKAERLKRDENLRYIHKHGRQYWKEDSGYHMRSLVETTMFRLRTIFGDELSARLLETQTTQVLIRCLAFNKMTLLECRKAISWLKCLLQMDNLCLLYDLCTKASQKCWNLIPSGFIIYGCHTSKINFY